MGKKRSIRSQASAQAFQAQISNAQIKALEPFVTQVVQHNVQLLGQNLAKKQLSYSADASVRISALESIICDKLGYTRESLAELALELEDKALGLAHKSTPAEKGDHLRVELRVKGNSAPEGQPLPEYAEKGYVYIVKDLLGESPAHILNRVELSEVLLGASEGESLEVLLEDLNATFKLTVIRISSKIEGDTDE